jgi:hypothetical protein
MTNPNSFTADELAALAGGRALSESRLAALAEFAHDYPVPRSCHYCGCRAYSTTAVWTRAAFLDSENGAAWICDHPQCHDALLDDWQRRDVEAAP